MVARDVLTELGAVLVVEYDNNGHPSQVASEGSKIQKITLDKNRVHEAPTISALSQGL